MSRLFVCLWPPDHVVEALSELHRKDQVGATFVSPENWHVTLRFVGDADPNEVADALSQATFGHTKIELGPAVDIGSGRTMFVPANGADDLSAEVVRATTDLGDQAVRRTFRGHITIARVKKRANMPRALGELIAASWAPQEVALVQSSVDRTGARYDTLETWPVDQGHAAERTR